jgi:maleylacetoacetate isomerase
MSVKLYNYFRSSASWRVRIALNWKGIPYEYVAVNLIKDGGEHLQESYGSVNPLHAVPSLEIDGHVLSESIPIIEYLEETRPEPPLLPKDAFLRAQARRIAEVFNAGTQPMQNLRVLERLDAEFSVGAEGKKRWVTYFHTQSFARLERLLQTTAGAFCLGDEVTIADVGLVPQCYSARRFGMDLAQFPTIAAIERRLAALPAFEAAQPSKQPDCPAGQQ